MLNKIVPSLICCMLALACVPVAAGILNPDPKVNDDQPAMKLLNESFGQDKTKLIKKLLDKGGAALIYPRLSYPRKDGMLLQGLALAAEHATFEEWRLVTKYIKDEKEYSARRESDNSTLLHLAARNPNGGVEIAKFLIEEKKLDINDKNKYKRSPLFFCNDKTIDYFLSQNPDIEFRDIGDNSPLLSFCAQGKEGQEIVIKLLNLGADVFAVNKITNDYPLIKSSSSGQPKAIPVLLKAMANRDKQPETDYLKYKELTAYGIWVDGLGNEIFWANYPYNERFSKITDANLNITPLLWAIGGFDRDNCKPDEQLATVKALIAAGADVNYIYRYWCTSADDRAQDILDPTQSSWDFPLFYVKNGEFARALINAGADVDVKDKFGNTALIHHTYWYNSERGTKCRSVPGVHGSSAPTDKPLEVIEVLLRHCADPLMPCGIPKFNRFVTPYQIALKNNEKQVINLYRKYGKGIGDPYAK